MPVASLRRRNHQLDASPGHPLVPTTAPPLASEQHGRVGVGRTDVRDVLPQRPAELHERCVERDDAVLGVLPLTHAQVCALGAVDDVVQAQGSKLLEPEPGAEQQLHTL